MENYFLDNVISPSEEMLAYETLYALKGQTSKTMADHFKGNDFLPSDVLKRSLSRGQDLKEKVEDYLNRKNGFSVSVRGDFQYPKRLEEVRNPPALFYYRGNIDLLTAPKIISIVGSRKMTEEGRKRAVQLTEKLVKEGYFIVSGLAKGIDTTALTTAIKKGGAVIGVIGTPFDRPYPPENKDLHEEITNKYLLISHVPFFRFSKQSLNEKKGYMAERNAIMSAISHATVIMEASDTSGTLYQARAAISQGRKLFVLDSCFQNKAITWPARYEKKGAIRLKEIGDILRHF